MKTKVYIVTQIFFALKLLGFQPVEINQASVEQIALLPGIGESTAQKIIKHREKKPFTKMSDLGLVDGISEKKIAALFGKINFTSTSKKAHHNEALKPLVEQKENELIIYGPKTISVSLAELERHVLKNAGLMIFVEENMKERARLSGLVPKISFTTGFDHHEADTQKNMTKANLVNRSGDGFAVGLKASFNLPSLVFASEEIEIEKLNIKKHELREKILSKLHRTYFSYEKLGKELEGGLKTPIFETKNQELRQLHAELDSLSGGYLSSFHSEEKGSF